jgi:hypothetical protein
MGFKPSPEIAYSQSCTAIVAPLGEVEEPIVTVTAALPVGADLGTTTSI